MAKKIDKTKKFCPACGTQNNIKDAFCIKCGYGFFKKKKKGNIKSLILVLIVIAIIWVALRLYLKRSIIPEGFSDLLGKSLNLSKNVTGAK